MKFKLYILLFLVNTQLILSATIIERWRNYGNSLFNSLFSDELVDFSIDDTCNLPTSLKNEIRAYQPIVDRIVNFAVDGEFSGSTWNRFVLRFVNLFVIELLFVTFVRFQSCRIH